MQDKPEAVILCGGAGLRLKSITGNSPKPMASIAGRPFLELLLRQLARNGFGRVVLAVGYGKEVIRSEFGDGAFGLKLEYAEEAVPLGTGGALRNACTLLETESCVVMNGDSYTDAQLGTFVGEYQRSGADASLIGSPADDRSDCGWMLADGSGRLLRFHEKTSRAGACFINAGIYVIAARLLRELPLGMAISLETEAFPRWISEGRDIRVFADPAPCVDIGTPERYWNAQVLLAAAAGTQAPVPHGLE